MSTWWTRVVVEADDLFPTYISVPGGGAAVARGKEISSPTLTWAARIGEIKIVLPFAKIHSIRPVLRSILAMRSRQSVDGDLDDAEATSNPRPIIDRTAFTTYRFGLAARTSP